ncbi:AraC-like ligand binding domain protein [Corynebacterium faecale]|uniref:cupin domain-containing protein n=1 Tax=Corynebacterium faecale TaxID=1758466 RepID=UPI0025B43E79|nr:AraC family ligand binding domain-containing protein [Corynebacterium faecale]WJY91237.1 AraC-like ligand binding domain protein [Corynebacterium faecale]
MSENSTPTTQLIEEGELFDTKQMSATGSAMMPRHRPSRESALIVTEGQCIVAFDDFNRTLGQGDALILPEGMWHSVQADPAFTAVHIMPKGIRFTFSS